MRRVSERNRTSRAICLGALTLAWIVQCSAPVRGTPTGLLGGAGSKVGALETKQDASQMQKYVTQQGSFVLYKPPDWTCTEDVQLGFRTISVADPSGRFQAVLSYGPSPTGDELPALAKCLLGRMARQFPDVALRTAMTSTNPPRLVFDGACTDAQKGRRQFRCWLSVQGGEFTCLHIEAPEGRLAEKRSLLLTILSNIKIVKGSFTGSGGPAMEVVLVPHRLSDGSASFKIPQGWSVQQSGSGLFVANDPTRALSFISASAAVLTPQLRVQVPGVPVSPFLRPHQALQFLTTQARLATNMRFLEVTPRPEIAQLMSQVYTSGPVLVEDFLYTCTAAAGSVKGYSLGISFGSYVGANWSFRHLTVAAPADQFDAFAPHFADMLQSYAIDEEWARQYIARGIARLRQLHQQTSQIVARNAEEIRQTMQAAYDERQRSQDYIDYQRTNTIRGQQDWVSSVEGGTIYHTDSWGTKNTATGEYWDGQPYDYVHFEGDNPKYREQMTPIDTRRLWERHIE